MSRFWNAVSQRAGYFTAGIVAILVVGAFRSHAGMLGIRGPDDYWVLHWVRDYSNGFVRRGFLGEALGSLGFDASDYVILTVLTWCISLALALFLIEAAFRLSRGLSAPEATLFLLLIVASPATVGLIAETTGDPLQLVLLAYMVLHWGAFVASPVSPWGAAILFGIFGLVAGLIHEATLFLVFPAAVVAAFVLVRTTAARVAAGAFLVGIAIAVAAAIPASGHAAGEIGGGYIHVGDARLELPRNVFVSFSDIVTEKRAGLFGRGFVGYLDFAKSLVGGLLVPFYLACLVSAVSFGAEKYGLTDRRQVWAAFAIPILLSAPLYLVAHDWGRFAGYGFMTSLILLSMWRTERAPTADKDRTGILAITLLLFCVVMPLPSIENYRISGLAVDYRIASSGIVFVALIAVTYRRFWRAQLGV